MRILNKFFVLLSSAFCLANVTVASATEHNPNFKIFDGTMYSNRPSFVEYGIHPLKVIYASALWPNKQARDGVPDLAVIAKLAEEFKSNNADILCLDIEHWSIQGNNKNKNLEKYQKTIQLFKKSLKDSQIGYYGLMPERNYWASMEDGKGKKNIIWQNTNIEHAAFAKSNLDVIFPSLYTFYNNQEDWAKFAIEHIKEAKKYGKPVYAFLWPLYHESNFWRKHEYIGNKYWRLQLETVFKHADGVVIWGGWDFKNSKPFVWDEQSEWWQETKNFIKDKNTK